MSLILLLFIFWPPIDGRQHYEAYLGLSFLIILLAQHLIKQLHWSVGLTFGYMALSALKGFFFPVKYPINISIELLNQAGGEVLYSLVMLLLFTIILLIKDRYWFRYVIWLLTFAAVLNAMYILFSGLEYGMLNNKASDASFIACMLPMANFICWPIMIAGILATKSSTGIAGVGVAIAAMLFQKFNIRKFICIVTPLTILIVIFSYLYLGEDLLFHSGRKYVYANAWMFYQTYINPWLGAGTGTFTTWGVASQKLAKFPEIWTWLHNDYLEVLFENGIVGLVLCLGTYFYLIRSLFRRHTDEFSTALVYGFIALTQMPLRLYVTQLLGVCLLARAFKDET